MDINKEKNMNVAIIKNNKVENIAVFESLELAQEMYPDAICIDTAVTTCGIGWRYDPTTGECIAPTTFKFNKIFFN